jgi:hypothetical protein
MIEIVAMGPVNKKLLAVQLHKIQVHSGRVHKLAILDQ